MTAGGGCGHWSGPKQIPPGSVHVVYIRQLGGRPLANEQCLYILLYENVTMNHGDCLQTCQMLLHNM